ncbi:MAG: malate synthase G [Xanthomonadales bacterium]|nr:malate synthase G [Xanthomonadales bacterium]
MNKTSAMPRTTDRNTWPAAIDPQFLDFINNEVLPLTKVNADSFWSDLNTLLTKFTPRNRELLQVREEMQAKIDTWHRTNEYHVDDLESYKTFLKDIGYLLEEGPDFLIETENVDPEIATIAGPQLVVPVQNARFALNALNARWGSLYDALYGTNVINTPPIPADGSYCEARGAEVIRRGRDFLDEIFPLDNASHHDITHYQVYFQNFCAFTDSGKFVGLIDSSQFAGYSGPCENPSTILLRNNGLHVELQIGRSNEIGASDKAQLADIKIEAAVTTIMDCEDSVAAVDAEDKIGVYRNLLGLMTGELTATFNKGGKQLTRRPRPDRSYIARDGMHQDNWFELPGRSLMFIRNVGHLMDIDIVKDSDGNYSPEGILDGVVTALIGSLDVDRTSGPANSRNGSIYLVKPKMHGPDEVAFTCDLFNDIEDMLGLPRYTIKLGIMDEERRTTLNLKECIRVARHRVVFINTGFLDRTGDEIHTSMQAGAFLPKDQIKSQPWIEAYENRNVDIGLQCGFSGRAQIGKGMWAMPDEMAQMMTEKIAHPESGANTAWVPSPTAATLHAMHYHRVDVLATQEALNSREPASLDDLLRIALIRDGSSLSDKQIERELENNAQGILGYVVRWIDQGIGCSKVPDINNTHLMEDRATLRISSQHIANWLQHGLCSEQQVREVMTRMAGVVDEQNRADPRYRAMTPDTENSIAFQAACALVFEGYRQPNGYTEPLLHDYRRKQKTLCKPHGLAAQ